jgi:hypothetical protein
VRKLSVLKPIDLPGGGDGVYADDAFHRHFAQNVLGIETGHLGVFRILLHLAVDLTEIPGINTLTAHALFT